MTSDANYILALKSGSERALKLIMEQWYSRLFNFANGYLNDHEIAKEVMQDVFLQLWVHRDKLADNTSLNAYLFTLTRNRSIDAIRRKRLQIQFLTNKSGEFNYLTNSFYALSDPILDDIFSQEFQMEINRAVDSLSEQPRKVFLLSREKGMKNKEIGELLNLSQKTVESHLTKALKVIRFTLEKKFPESFNLFLIFTKKLKSVSF